MENKNFITRDRCGLCGSQALEIKLSQDLTDQKLRDYTSAILTYGAEAFRDWKYVIARCPSCDFFFDLYPPVEYFFTRGYSHTTKHLPRELRKDVSYFAPNAAKVEKIGLLLDKNPADIRVLEFGAGFGYWLLMAKAFGYGKTAGIEVLPERIAYGRALGLSIHASLDDIPGEQFDFIYTYQVFEHMLEPLAYLKKLVTYLAPGGILELGLPEGNHTQKTIDHYTGTPVKLIDPFSHINAFTHRAVVSFGMHAGLVPLPATLLPRILLKSAFKERSVGRLQEAIRAYRMQKYGCTVYFKKA